MGSFQRQGWTARLLFGGSAAGDICLPQASDGGNLPGMPTARDIGLPAGPARPQVMPPVVVEGLSKHRPPQDRTDTLHCSPEVTAEAVQFNSEVSAMPPNHSQHSHVPVPMGTADTSLLR